jgi:hypothetical protein
MQSLEANQTAAVVAEMRKRNYQRCLNGASTCDPVLLTAPESAEAAEAYRQRERMKVRRK